MGRGIEPLIFSVNSMYENFFRRGSLGGMGRGRGR